MPQQDSAAVADRIERIRALSRKVDTSVEGRVALTDLIREALRLADVLELDASHQQYRRPVQNID